MMTKERKTYDQEFKQKAVELSFERGNAKEIAESLISGQSYYIDGVENTRNMNKIVF